MKVSITIIIALLLCNFINNSFGQDSCYISTKYLQISQPSQEMLTDFKQFENDSLHLFSSNCRLLFYENYVFCLRRLEREKEALHKIDSIVNAIIIKDELTRGYFLLEKAIILYNAIDSSAEAYLDSLQDLIVQNTFYSEHKNKKKVLDILSRSAAVFSNAERFEFTNDLLMKQMELNTIQDSIYIFRNNFMIGLNNLNSRQYHTAYEFLRKAELYSKSERVDSSMCAEMHILLGTTLSKIDSLKLAKVYFRRGLEMDQNKLIIRAYYCIGLMEIFEKENQTDSLRAYEPMLIMLSKEPELIGTVRLDIYYYLSSLYFSNKDMAKFEQSSEYFIENMDDDRLYHRYIRSKLNLQQQILSSNNPKFVQNLTSFIDLKSESESEEHTHYLNSWKHKYESDKSNLQNQLLTTENQLKQLTITRQRGLLIIGAAGLISALLLAFGINQKRISNRKDIELKQEKLKSQDFELELARTENIRLQKSNAHLQERIEALKNEPQNILKETWEINPKQSERVMTSFDNILSVQTSKKNQIKYILDNATTTPTEWRSLTKLEEDPSWPKEIFMRVYQSNIINLYKVFKIDSTKLIVRLYGIEQSINISPKKIEELQMRVANLNSSLK